ncbi:MAG: hypothetical protein ACT4NX_05590 [Deltaproteobacteria bacterium]
MKIMDILESRIKETLSTKAILEAERNSLAGEVAKLSESLRELELEREEARETIKRIIEKIELYLSRSEA